MKRLRGQLHRRRMLPRCGHTLLLSPPLQQEAAQTLLLILDQGSEISEELLLLVLQRLRATQPQHLANLQLPLMPNQHSILIQQSR